MEKVARELIKVAWLLDFLMPEEELDNYVFIVYTPERTIKLKGQKKFDDWMRVRGYKQVGFEKHNRDEVNGLPKISGFLGPFYKGASGFKRLVEYESRELYKKSASEITADTDEVNALEHGLKRLIQQDKIIFIKRGNGVYRIKFTAPQFHGEMYTIFLMDDMLGLKASGTGPRVFKDELMDAFDNAGVAVGHLDWR